MAEKVVQKDILDPNGILLAEFNYASQTAFQANEDRVRVFGYIIANVATILAAIILPNISSAIDPKLFAAIFLGLSIVGLFFLFQLSRLRVAWIDSVKTMNHIKDYYIAHFKEIDLYKAFRWRTSTIPSNNKVWSLAFLLAFTIIFFNSISLGLAVAIFVANVPAALISGFVFMLIQILLWNRLIKG